jgi:hypothetical protein
MSSTGGGHAELAMNEEAFDHDNQMKKIGKYVGKLYSKEYSWFRKIPDSTIIEHYGKKTQGCEPDAGIFCRDGLPQVIFEAKKQDKSGQAGYQLAYKNLDVMSLINPNCDYIILAMGEGAISKNPDGKTKADIGVWNCFAHNLKVEFDNHPSGKRLNTHVYQSPNGFTDEEVMDIMKKHLDAKLGLSENIVTLSPIPLRGVLDV